MKKTNRILSFIIALLFVTSMMPAAVAEQTDRSSMADISTLNGSAYKLYNYSLSWTEAKRLCELVGGHLITLDSSDESEVMNELLASSAAKNCYWIGVERHADGVRWQKITGEVIYSFNWAPNEPNDTDGIEDYVHVFGCRYTGGKGTKLVGQWNDASDNGAGYVSDFYSQVNFGLVCEWDNPNDMILPDLLYGDVNRDGKIDAADALLVLKAAVGKEFLTAEQTIAADVDGSAALDAADALLILQKAVNKIDKFPVEK